jgi:uncharacterized membrane protein
VSWIWFLLGGVCHQLPEHSLVFQGQPLPLCARCTGAFVGLAGGLVTLVIMGRGRRVGLPSRSLWPWLGMLMLAWILDGTNALVSDLVGSPWLYAPRLDLRLATGTGAGIALATFLYPIAQYACWREVREGPVLERLWQLALLLAVGAVVSGGLRSLAWLPWELGFALVTLATGTVFMIANGALVSLLTREHGTAMRLWQTWPYALAGLILSVFEMGGVALLRRWLEG